MPLYVVDVCPRSTIASCHSNFNLRQILLPPFRKNCRGWDSRIRLGVRAWLSRQSSVAWLCDSGWLHIRNQENLTFYIRIIVSIIVHRTKPTFPVSLKKNYTDSVDYDSGTPREKTTYIFNIQEVRPCLAKYLSNRLYIGNLSEHGPTT